MTEATPNNPPPPPDDASQGSSPAKDQSPCPMCKAESACPICHVLHAARGRRWNPYVVGALIGVLSWVTFLAMGKALGTSTTMVHLSGTAVGLVAPDHVTGDAANPYYGKYFNPPTKNNLDWQFLLVIGLPIGAWIGSRLLSRDEKFTEHVPRLWAQRFGPSKPLRYTAAFVGGAILLFGARLAGGCTSGHGISGGLQLAVSSWTFFIAMFVAGVAAAFAMFGLKGRNYVDG